MADIKVRRLESLAWIGKSIDEYWDSMRTAPERGEKVAWVVGPAVMITLAMGMPSLMHATYAAYIAGRKKQGVVLDAAAEEGYLPETCSYIRAHVGDISLLKKGAPLVSPLEPLPDVVIGGTICPEQRTLTELIYHMTGRPTAVVDCCPAGGLEEASEAEVESRIRYVERQLRDEAIPVIEKVTGRPYDYDRLSWILANLKECATIRNEILELMKHKPCPMIIFDLGIALAPLMHLMGDPEAPAFFRRLKAEVEDRVKNGVGALTEERYRLYWDNYTSWGFLGTLSRIMFPLGANIVCNRYAMSFWPDPDMIEPEKPLYTLSKQLLVAMAKYIMVPDGFKNWLFDKLPKYSIDGLLMASSPGCRLMSICQQDIMDEVERKLGIPGVLFDVDMVDPAMFSEAQARTRVEALLEMIDARRMARTR